MRDIVGQYLDPSDNAHVLSVDEKSQIQTLERMQPNLPLKLGYAEGITHSYTRHGTTTLRHGTTTLFAALEISRRATSWRSANLRHRHQEFCAFLRNIEANLPAHLAVHLILDTDATYAHAKVRAWLATTAAASHPFYANVRLPAQSSQTAVRFGHRTHHPLWLLPHRP